MRRAAITLVLLALAGLPTSADAELTWGGPVLTDDGQGVPHLECPTTSLCVMADPHGFVRTTGDPLHERAWTRSRGRFADFSDLSCLAGPFCVAVTARGELLASTDPAGGSDAWSRTRFDTWFFAVDCASPSLCVAVDRDGFATVSTEPLRPESWKRVRIRTTTPCEGPGTWSCHGTGYRLLSVSCPSSELCVVGDHTGDVITSTDPTGGSEAWKLTDVDSDFHPGRVAGSPAGFPGVDCPSESFCALAQDAGFAYTTSNPTGDAGAWIKSGSWSGYAEQGEVECPSTSLCLRRLGPYGRYAAVSTNPAAPQPTWKPLELPTPIGAFSCPTDALCLAADEHGSVYAGLEMPDVAPFPRPRLPTLLRRRRHAMLFTAPVPGYASVEWRHRGTLVARGRHYFGEAKAARVAVRVTDRGRALMRKARRMSIDATAAFGPVEKTERFTLKR